MAESRNPVHLIVNPISGYTDQKKRLDQFRQAVLDMGLDLVEHQTTGPGNAAEYTSAHANKAHAIVSWGGDGTSKDIATALINTSTPLLVTYGGTENLLAKVMGIPKDPANMAQLLVEPQTIDFDLAHCNGDTFHSILGVGFDAEVVREVHKNRSGHITHLHYAWPILKTWLRYKFPMLKITADGEDIFHGWGIAFVGNTHRYSMNLHICRDAQPDDDLLDLVVFQCNSRHSLLKHAFWTILRKHPEHRSVIYKKVKHVRIESDRDEICELDGDTGPTLPLDVTISPHKIKMIVPKSV